ncbi:SMI1/KNR4 family protein [Actinoplanes sp. NPDC051851]|uniref:SMI1/KNR4 family protein n=1 Tax=Actinoplanes sp. NPDC051851 TaxID=3154753 RepID=UPI00343903C7
MDRDSEISAMVSAKRLLRDADREALWRHDGPRSPATEQAVRQAEEAIGFPLGNEYSSSLMKADGWPAILQEIDLFGCPDLTGAAFSTASADLGYLEHHAAEAAGLLNTDMKEAHRR